MGWRGLLGGLLALGCAAGPALAQAWPAEDAHELARSFLSNTHAGRALDDFFTAKRDKMIENVKRQFGKDETQAAMIIDQFMMPELRAGKPDLLTRFEDVLVRDFTPDELRSMAYDKDDAARQSARAKAPQMQADFAASGRAWGETVGHEVFAKNRAALKQLDFDEKAFAQ